MTTCAIVSPPSILQRVNAHGHGFCQRVNAHRHGFCPSQVNHVNKSHHIADALTLKLCRLTFHDWAPIVLFAHCTWEPGIPTASL